MANFNLTITNEGAAFLADIIANQGTIDFTEVRFSSTNYVGSEATLTEGTFAGTFITATPTASVLDSTTIKVASSFDNSSFTSDKVLYSIGIIAEDGNGNIALVAVCTTSSPDTIPQFVLTTSVYAFNINLSVSNTQNITVTASGAGVVFVSDIVNNLTSSETNKPLSAAMGKALNNEISAIENVYSSKNLNSYPYNEKSKVYNGVTYTVNDDGTVKTNNTASGASYFYCHHRVNTPNKLYLKNGEYTLTGCPAGGTASTYRLALEYADPNNTVVSSYDYGNGVTFTINGSYGDADGAYVSLFIDIASGTLVDNFLWKPMVRDASISDDTYVPPAMTNRELTEIINGSGGVKTATINTTNCTKPYADSEIYYVVRSGICFVAIVDMKGLVTGNNVVWATGLPKAAMMSCSYPITYSYTQTAPPNNSFYVNAGSTSLNANIGDTSSANYVTLSYVVEE